MHKGLFYYTCQRRWFPKSFAANLEAYSESMSKSYLHQSHDSVASRYNDLNPTLKWDHHFSIHISKFYHILFYHFKKLFYQLHHTILQYFKYHNFYFIIQHIKIVFLHSKIIYHKTQIKTKIQNLVRERNW